MGELNSKINAIAKEMEGFRKSFEYIQDYINIPGLRLWQEEISRIINHAVEKEAAGFLKNAGESYTQYQSFAVPIPEFAPLAGDSSRTFMGRLVREILAVTEPGQSLYVESVGCWYSPRAPHSEVLGQTFTLQLELALGIPGLAGVNRLFGLMTISQIQAVQRQLATDLQSGSEVSRALETAVSQLREETELVSAPGRTYSGLTSKISRHLQVLHSSLSSVGQLTQLRRTLCCRLMSASKFDSKLLHSCLQTLQLSLLSASLQPDCQFPPPGEESELLAELINHLQWVGLDDPTSQVYSPVIR